MHSISFILLIIITIFSFLISSSYSFIIKLNQKNPKFCISKYIPKNYKISFSYLVTSDPKEPIRGELRETVSKTQLYHKPYGEKGDYKSGNLSQDNGNYELCFYVLSLNELYVSIEFNILMDEYIDAKDLVTDKQVKGIIKEVIDIRDSVSGIESNARHLFAEKYRHLKILKEIVGSIKMLTCLKILIVSLLSTFQVYVIKMFFGNEKRISKINVKNNYNDNINNNKSNYNYKMFQNKGGEEFL